MEYRRKCTVCGHIYCYDDQDIKKNTTNSWLAGISAIGGIASALSGNKIDMVIGNQNMQRNSSDKIIDFERCPMCNSKATIQYTGDSIETQPKSISTPVVINPNATAESLLKRIRLLLEDEEWDKAKQYCEQVLDLDAENPYAYLYELLAEWEMKSIDDLSDVSDYEENALYLKTIRFADPELKNQLLDIRYQRYNRMLQEAETEDEYLELEDYFDDLGEYKDSIELKKKCSIYADEVNKNEKYNTAISLMKEEQIFSFENAVKILKNIDGWKDADKQIKLCEKKIAGIKAKEEADRLEAKCKAEEERIAAEKKAEEDRIASEKAAKKRKKAFAIGTPIVAACIAFVIVLTTVIIPNNKYNAAIKLMDDEKYEEAISAFEAMNGYKDSENQIESCYYNAAVALMNDGKYEEAISAFEALNGYKDSENQIESCYIGKYGEEKWNKIKNIKVGDTYTFGAYEQDNSTSNGKEAIEWTVLDKDGMSLLLVSKYALDCQQYKSTHTNVTWETCSLRKWMNGTFLNNAFSAEEQAQIQNTNVSADKNPKYSTNPGNATTDKVFLLSITEAEKYFTTDESRKCAPTAYAKSQGAFTSDSYKTASGEATCFWWLRSPGYTQAYAASVYDGGSVYCGGYHVYTDDGCVRPALWINLE